MLGSESYVTPFRPVGKVEGGMEWSEGDRLEYENCQATGMIKYSKLT